MPRGSTRTARPLALYELLSRFPRLGYAAKIMLVAFVGTHVPLLALLVWSATTGFPSEPARTLLIVAGLATLAGTAATLVLIGHLLRPIALTSRGLRRYVLHGILPELPSGHEDMAGTLMADASYALRRLDAAIETLEQHDPLTGLPNRTALLRALAARTGEDGGAPLAVCAIELLGLDAIARAFGRRAAERALLLVLQRLVAALGTDGRLFRAGAATFVAVLDAHEPERIARRLEAVRERVRRAPAEDGTTDLDCRAGVSLGPLDDTDAEALLDDALVALHVASRRGAPLAFYSETSRRALVERQTLLTALRRALGRDDELALHYQPIVDVRDGAIVGAEALLRWRSPLHGNVSPARFVPLAEDGELIERIGRWTLRTACRQIAAWRASGLHVPRVSVNLSARQFVDADLPRHVGALIAEHDVPRATLEIELTETSALGDEMRTASVMHELRALGVGIAIDDFGTGHSSMSHLRAMPFSKLKIDRQFVRGVDGDPDQRAICRSLIVLGRELGLEVLAEGTECAAEVETLEREGCHVFQGYHFHRPMPADALTELLRGRVATAERV